MVSYQGVFERKKRDDLEEIKINTWQVCGSSQRGCPGKRH